MSRRKKLTMPLNEKQRKARALATLKRATAAQLAGDYAGATKHHLALFKLGEPAAASYYHAFIRYRIHRDYAGAEKLFRHAILCGLDTAHVWHNLGCVLRDQAKLDLAQLCFAKALERDPGMVESYSAYASMAYERGDAEDAQLAWGKAFLRLPDTTDAAQLYDLSIQYLTFGEYRTGWELHRHRWDAPLFQNAHARPPGPEWDGESRVGALYVFAEQGHGDAIMLLRWLPWLSQFCGRLHLAIHAGLIPLVQRNYPDVLVQRLDGDAYPPYDAHVSLFDLPCFAGMAKPEDIPGAPYLTAEPAQVPVGRYRVGLVWAGGKATHHDWRRSIPFDTIRPLLDAPVGWQILQTERLEEFDAASLKTSVWHRHVNPIANWHDTARAVKTLNLLITVDTGIAHLAGAMGIPTWLMLPRMPDYRWGLTGDTTPWYPSLRLFRARKALEWRDVVADVRAALAQWGPERREAA